MLERDLNQFHAITLENKCISVFKNSFRNVKVIIDGAHGLGSLPLDIHSLDPDYYVSNGHKWFCCPKGAAFMYVRKELQPDTHSLIISHGFGSGFNSEFIWAGEAVEYFISLNPFPHTTILQQTTLNIFCQKIEIIEWIIYE